MRDDRLAERTLSLLMHPDRAAAAVGDLLEAPRHSRARFWRAIASVAISCVLRDVAAAPARMAFAAVVAWFGYMLATLLVLFGAYLAAIVLVLVFTVLRQHTGVELLVDVLGVDRMVQSDRLIAVIETSIVVVVTPFLMGRRVADVWQERAVAFVAAVAIVWTGGLVALIPFVGFYSKVDWLSLPIMMLFVLAGAITRRQTTLTAASRV